MNYGSFILDTPALELKKNPTFESVAIFLTEMVELQIEA